MAMNKKQTIQLTEQDLHMLVEDAVRTYLVNEGMDEGFWGGAKAMGQRAMNKFNNTGAYETGTNPPAAKPQGNFFNRMGQRINNFGNSVTNAQRTYQMGSSNQDAQKAITNALNALKSLQDADTRMKQAGGGGLQGQAQQAVDNAIKALSQKGATGMSSRFQQAANGAANGGTFASW
jgi:hypothetical protein